MKKVSKIPIKFGAAICMFFLFAAATILFSTYANAETIKYSEAIEYTVTTYEDSSSNLEYSPNTKIVNDNPYTYFTVTEKPTPSKKPLSTKSVQKRTIAKGSKYATDLYIIDSGKPGPVVMIIGGVHGNETAGYRAAEKAKNYDIKKGTLLVLPQANKLAVEAGRRYAPGESDLNRLFPQSSSTSPQNVLAKDIYNIIKEYKVDWLMDMHEGFDYYKNSTTSSVGQTLIYYPANNARSIVEDIVNDLNKGMIKSLHKFTLLKYPVKGSIARSSAEHIGVKSFIFETSMKQTLSTRISQQEQAAQKLLSNLGML